MNKDNYMMRNFTGSTTEISELYFWLGQQFSFKKIADRVWGHPASYAVDIMDKRVKGFNLTTKLRLVLRLRVRGR
jgi:hypothetical protein